MTALTVLPAAASLGKLGELARVKPFADIPRTLKLGDKEFNLIPSRNASARAVQRGYDKIVQGALDKEQSGDKIGRIGQRVAAHGVKRIKGVVAEEERGAQRMREVPANMLEHSAARLRFGQLPRSAREHQAALEMTSNQTMPEDAALYHEAQAAKGVNPEQNAAVARLYRRVAQNNLVKFDENRPVGEQVHINPAEKHLAMTDERLANVGHRGDAILIEHNLMTPEGAQTAIDNPGRVRTGAEWNNPTPGKLGVPSNVLKEAESQVARLEKLHARAVLKAMGDTRRASTVRQAREAGYYETPWEQSPVVQGISGALSIAKDRLQKLEAMHEGRIEETGLVGGDEAHVGRTHISYKTSEKTAQSGPAVRFTNKVTGKASSPINSHEFTGESIRQGQVPKDITGAKARTFRQIVRHENTVAQRDTIWQTGSDESKGTGHEVLLGNPDHETKLGKIGQEARQLIGQEVRTFDKAHELTQQETDAAEAEGIRAALEQRVASWLDKAHEHAGRVAGLKAPENYRWVDERLLRGLQDQIASSSSRAGTAGEKIGRAFDNVNSAVTSATVYFKFAHTFTRGLTNSATNLMQGSLDPFELAKTWKFEKDAKAAFGKGYDEFRQRILAASGQMGYSALPHEGTEGMIGRGISGLARKGSGFWARRFDAPFRINALLYELRKAGYETPEEVSRALDGIQTGGRGMAAHEWSKLSSAFRRADREAISYDRLNEFERHVLSRAIWFYPWVKGSTMFTLRSMVEHPFKVGVAGALGVEGRKYQEKLLGPVPSYEQGLIPLSGGTSPETVDMSTFSPFSTAGQLANIPSVPGGLAQQFNPALASIMQYAEGVNQYGEPSNSPLSGALASLVSSTPETQIADAFRRQGQDTSVRMFPGMSPGAELLRYLLGPGLSARRVNLAALAKAAAREHDKRFTVYSGG